MRRSLLLLAALPLLGGATSGPDETEACVDVRVGAARSYDCINRVLQSLAVQAHGAVVDAPSALSVQVNRTGQATESATRERLGTAFGHSAIPARPSAIYANPVR